MSPILFSSWWPLLGLQQDPKLGSRWSVFPPPLRKPAERSDSAGFVVDIFQCTGGKLSPKGFIGP